MDIISLDIIGNLPVELAQEIFMHLPPDDLHNAWYCSTQWQYQMEDEMFWKKKCKRDGFQELEEKTKSEIYTNFTQHYPNYWMGVYMYYRALYFNWRNNVYKETTVSHNDTCFVLKHFDDEIAILATNKNDIVILDSISGTVKQIFTMDERVVCDIQKYNDLLLGRGCQKFKVWNMKTRECLFQYVSEDLVKLITIYKNYVTTMVTTIYHDINGLYIVDIETGKVVYRRENITTACMDNDICALAKLSGEIEIFNLNFNQVNVLKAENKLDSLQIVIKGDYLIHFCQNYLSEGFSYLAFIWNVRTAKLLRKIAPVFNYESTLFLHDDKMIYSTVDADGRDALHFCNFITGELLVTLYNSFPSPSRRAVNNKFMFMKSTLYGSVDGWCLKTGNLIIKTNIKNCVKFLMTEHKLAYFDDHMVLHILNYEHKMEY